MGFALPQRWEYPSMGSFKQLNETISEARLSNHVGSPPPPLKFEELH